MNGSPSRLVRLLHALPPRNSAAAWLIGGGVTAFAVAAKVSLDSWAGAPLPPYITLYPAIVLVSLVGGARMGLLATAVSLAVAWRFWLPSYNDSALPQGLTPLTLAIFAVTASFLAWIIGLARATLDEAAAGESERAVAAQESVHRIKNLLAVVQAISAKVAAESETVMEFRNTLSHRLAALGVAQDVLLRRDWQDAELQEVVQSALAPFLPNPGLHVEPDAGVIAPARYVRGLSVALYELCTNAMKYGALAGGRGPVFLSWRTEGDLCILEWRESLSEPAAPGAHSGLGTLLIRAALSREKGTDVQYEITANAVFAAFRWPRPASAGD